MRHGRNGNCFFAHGILGVLEAVFLEVLLSYTVFQTANTCLNISLSTCPIATYISLYANNGIHVARVSNQSPTSSDGALWLDTFYNKCFTVGIKWYVRGNRASAGIQCTLESRCDSIQWPLPKSLTMYRGGALFRCSYPWIRGPLGFKKLGIGCAMCPRFSQRFLVDSFENNYKKVADIPWVFHISTHQRNWKTLKIFIVRIKKYRKAYLYSTYTFPLIY
jgi:hypothetical protein